MKKIIVMILATIILTGCAKQQEEKAKPAQTATETSVEKLITLTSPKANEVVQSPFIITGKAKGNWFFEGSFPVVLTNADGLTITETIATAKGNWMTESYVDFEANLNFISTDTNKKATLILKKDNPSGLPENDMALEIPVILK